MKLRNAFGAIAAIIIALGGAAPALGASSDGTTPASAIVLTGSRNGSSVGSGAGSDTYYNFNYPGDGSVGTLTLTFFPTDPATANAIGVNLYQGGKLLATMNGVGNPPGSHALSFSSTTAGPMLVQVYNYSPGVPVSFQLSLSGVGPATSSPTPTPPMPTAPAGPGDLTGPVSGTLAGDAGGSYATYTIPFVGAGVAQSVIFSFWPNTGPVAPRVYVVAYQNGTKIGSVNGTQTSNPGNLTLWYIANSNGPVQIQVGNYAPGTTIGYTLTP